MGLSAPPGYRGVQAGGARGRAGPWVQDVLVHGVVQVRPLASARGCDSHFSALVLGIWGPAVIAWRRHGLWWGYLGSKVAGSPRFTRPTKLVGWTSCVSLTRAPKLRVLGIAQPPMVMRANLLPAMGEGIYPVMRANTSAADGDTEKARFLAAR